MNVQRLTIIASAVAAGLAFSGASHAITYSLGGDFSDAVNPNGPWSFVQGTTLLTHFLPTGSSNALNGALSNGFWAPGPNLDFASPTIGKVTTNGAAAVGYTNADFLTGDVILASTNPSIGASELFSVRWTAPSAGTINVSASTWYAHSPVPRSNDVTVLLGTTTLGSGAVSSTSFAGRGNPLNFSFSNLAVAAGSVLSFRYTPTAGQQFGSIAGLRETVDFTPSVVTAPIPEPTTWAMMGMGLTLLVGVSKRKRA